MFSLAPSVKEIDIENVVGSRRMFSQSLNLYQLEYFKYNKKKNYKKHRSYFYRPQEIVNHEVWDLVKRGQTITTGAEFSNLDIGEKTE